MKHRMTRALCLVLPALFCLSCSGQSDQKDDLRPYSDPRLVSAEPFVHAFAHLQEQGQVAFRYTLFPKIISLIYCDDFRYDEGQSFHVELRESYLSDDLTGTVFLTGYYSTSADPEVSHRITVRPLCGLWGEGDYDRLRSEEMFVTEVSGLGSYVFPYHLVYPMVYAERGDGTSLPEDFDRFLTLSLFERMMNPIEEALQELGEYAYVDVWPAAEPV